MAFGEERWSYDGSRENFQRFDEARARVLRATRKLLEQYCLEHFDGKEVVVEIGSGLGFLRENWPSQFNDKWIQVDFEESLLGRAHGQRVAADAYALPFRDSSVDVVCGFGSFDTFYGLENVIGQVRRVLKETGSFFHLLDLQPNREAILYDLKKNGKTFFPEDLGLIQLILDGNKEAFEEAVQKYRKKHDVPPHNDYVPFDIRRKYGVWVDQHSYFERRLASALRKHFGDVKADVLYASFLGKNQASREQGNFHRVYTNIFGNLSSNLMGTPYSNFDFDSIPKGHCLEVSANEIGSCKKSY